MYTFYSIVFTISYLVWVHSLSAQTVSGLENRTVPTAMPMVILDTLPYQIVNGETHYTRDLRHKDCSGLDLTDHFPLLLMCEFDSRTIWPPKEMAPEHFRPELMQVFSANPGVNVREAAKAGHLATGTHIVLIGPPLLTGHEEYRHRLESYTPVGRVSDTASIDGTAWTSMIVGKTSGVTFDSRVHYYAVPHSIQDGNPMYSNLELLATLKKVVALKTLLPNKDQLTCVALPYDIDSNDELFGQIEAECQRLRDVGVAIISARPDLFGPETRYLGVGREPLRNPQDYLRWRPAHYWYNNIESVLSDTVSTLYFPLDSRYLAAPTGIDDYALYRTPPARWMVPFIAGCYTIARSVSASVTLEEFFHAAAATSVDVKFALDKDAYELKHVINLLGLTEYLKKQK